MATRNERLCHGFYINVCLFEALQANIQRLCRNISPAGSAIDKPALMNALLDAAEEKLTSTAEEHTHTHDKDLS